MFPSPGYEELTNAARCAWSLLYESRMVCSQGGESCFHVRSPATKPSFATEVEIILAGCAGCIYQQNDKHLVYAWHSVVSRGCNTD